MTALAALRASLASMDDAELRHIVKGEHPPGAWGTSGDAEVDGHAVFLKRIPLTALEAARPASTRNHFRLPNYYSYGVGSAGFGVWRELAVHQLTADGGLYPALLHHRVMERPASGSSSPDGWPASLGDYVAYWNGNRRVGEFIEARGAATEELWVVLEHVPHVAWKWLLEHQERIDDLLMAAFSAIDELNDRGVVHFDAHLGNVVTDGERFALTDFGLANSAEFELTASERSFIARHRHYDYGVVLGSLGQVFASTLGIDWDGRSVAYAIDRLDELPVSHSPELHAVLTRYRDPMVHMVDFFARIRRPSKRARYDDDTFRAAFASARRH